MVETANQNTDVIERPPLPIRISAYIQGTIFGFMLMFIWMLVFGFFFETPRGEWPLTIWLAPLGVAIGYGAGFVDGWARRPPPRVVG